MEEVLVNNNKGKNGVTDKSFDWISVVLTGLVFFALAAWAEFAFFELRYDPGSNQNGTRELSEHMPEVEGGEVTEVSELAGSPNKMLSIEKVPLRLGAVIPGMSSRIEEDRLRAKKKQKFNRLFYAVGITIVAFVAVNIYNDSQK